MAYLAGLCCLLSFIVPVIILKVTIAAAVHRKKE